MSGGQTQHAWVVIFLIMIWVFNCSGAAKPRDPKPAPTPQKPTQPAPQKKVVNPQSLVPTPKTETPKAVAIAQTMPTRVVLENPATFTPEMTFGRALEILRRCTYPPINIVVLWRDLQEKANITQDTPIGLDGVPGLRIRQYIELLLRSVSAGSDAEVSYVLDHGVVLVATKDSLPKPKIETRVYDISDLAAPPSYGGSMPMMMPGMSPYGGVGSMQPYGNYGTGTPGMPYGNYSPGVGYNPYMNNTFNGYSQLPVNNTPRPSGVVLGGS